MSELIECVDNLTAEDIIRRIAKTANGVPFYLQTEGLGAAFCAEYQTLYDTLTTKPSDVIAAAQNTMLCGLLDDGVWIKLDVFYLFAQTTNGASEALVNWVNPGVFDGTEFNGPIAWVSLEGYTGNGTTQRINSPYNPTIHATNYAQNSASAGCYIRTNVDENKDDCGAAGGARVYIISRNAGNASYEVNDATTNNGANSDSRGLWVVTRTAVNARTLYRNKGIIHTTAGVASTGVPNATFQFLALSTFHGYGSKQQAMGFIGGGLTQTDVNNLTDRVETYMDSNGKGVIA